MSLDRNKVLEAAQKYLAKGQYDKAIAEYQKVLQADPKDVRTLLKIGDIHTKKGSTREACDAYLKVGEAYTQQGFHLKAVAVYKQILKLDPQRIDVYLKLASNYEQLELTSDAIQTYEQVAAVYLQRNEVDKGLQMLGKMTQLDPQNLPVRIRYAEALSKANRTADAAREFEFGANLLKQQGRIDDYIKVAERLLFHRAEDVVLARELAQLYLERNDGKRALAKLQVCFKANPKDTSVLDLLAQAFLKLDQKGKAISVYREIAKYHQEARRTDERARALKRILELDPSDAEARQALAGYAAPAPRHIPAEAVVPPGAVVGSVRAELPKPPAAPPRPLTAAPPVIKPPTAMPPRPPTAAPPLPPAAVMAPAHEPIVAPPPVLERASADLSPEPVQELETEEPQSEEVVVIDEEEEEEAAAAPATSAPPSPAVPPARPSVPPASREGRASVPPDVAVDAQVARLLTECDVFARYGLKQKILDQLERVVELAPHHVEARERLKDAYLEAGRTDDAVQQLLALGELFIHERPQLAQLYLKQVLLLDPENIDARAMMRPSIVPPPAVPHAVRATDALATPVPTGEPEPEAQDEGVMFVDDEASGPVLMPEDEGSGPLLVPEDEAPEEDIPTGTAHAKPASEPAPSLVRALTQSAETQLPSEPPRPAPPELRHVHAVPPPAFESAPPAYESAPPAAAYHAEPEPAPLVEEPAGLAPMTPEEFEAAPVKPPSEVPPAHAGPSSVEVEEILDEAEFYVAQGLWEEALSTIRDALSSHPTHPILLDKLQEIEEARDSAEQAQPGEAAPSSDEDAAFALAEKLAEELGPATEAQGHDVIDVENVFAQFKKGVEAQIDASDSETHYDLGIAYKEMGLLDDAVHEFDLAMRNVDKECIAATMIGLCRIEQGRADQSIPFFERALNAKHRDAREKLGLWFELGNAYALLAKKTEALGYYHKVEAMDPGFRGVDERIRALSAPPPVSAKVEVDPEDDELDKAFDELLGD
ncbi:MAG: tetratricopeptide repeat protein [Polyangiales bacterium]